jgi:hypothetical protein
MLFSARRDASLGLVGVTTLGPLLLIIFVSVIIIAWSSSRKEARRHSRYIEFDPTELERQNAVNAHNRLAKTTVTYYGLGIFCQYVYITRVANTGLPSAEFYLDLAIEILGSCYVRCVNSYPYLRHRPVIPVSLPTTLRLSS